MNTYKIKKASGHKGQNLRYAVKRIDFNGYVLAEDIRRANGRLAGQAGQDADALTYILDDSDIVVEVDADGNELESVVFED